MATSDVLDSRVRAKGVSRSRVADASVLPGHVSGSIMSSVCIIGERAADTMKEGWDLRAE